MNFDRKTGSQSARVLLAEISLDARSDLARQLCGGAFRGGLRLLYFISWAT